MTFRQANDRFVEKNAQVLGISCDSVHSHRAWSATMGGLNYPELSDFHPKGKVTTEYGLWNEERGAGSRAVIIVDKEGIIRHRQTYTPGVLPNAEELLEIVEKLS